MRHVLSFCKNTEHINGTKPFVAIYSTHKRNFNVQNLFNCEKTHNFVSIFNYVRGYMPNATKYDSLIR